MAKGAKITGVMGQSSPQVTRAASPSLDNDTQSAIAELLAADIEAFNASQQETQGDGSPTTRSASTLKDSVLELLMPPSKKQRSGSGSGWRSRKPAEQKSTDTDQSMELLRTLGLLAEGELDDHRAALAVERGEELPPPTQAQLALETNPFADILWVPMSLRRISEN
ncbi:hypothetical protein PAXRUDRAFT_157002 [Paxillus rubicundulus Ve08.2h10]|uniref:Unplaced genomic scaffold scaffold_1054, whole genome shotgun sequence n=1 Tax=Paxillus rubicundulus Ve08.2h10 TaxID=930991 RepID=A0A0D0DAR6_9AGAM|nr:hypothetical protein PAXRUDRAFT_157002 [Paxillus rubicundulus Ve08.2h10]